MQMSAEERASGLPHAGEEFSGGSIDIVGVVVAILREWRLGLITAVIVTAICLGIVLSLKKEFIATATFLPHEGRSQADGLASIFSYRGPGALYTGMLGSRFVQDDVIRRVGISAFDTSDIEVARAKLAGKSTFDDENSSIVTIKVRDVSSAKAAAIANAYLDGLRDLDERMGHAESSNTLQFFQGQLQQERGDLEHSEDKLAAAQKQTGIIQPETQTRLSLDSIAQLRSSITQLKVQLAALSKSETEANPEYQRVQSELGRLQAEEAALEAAGSTPMGAAPAAGQIPSANLDFQRAQREVDYHNRLVSSLASQYESAHLAEQFARTGFQVIDQAVAPEHTSWPPRKPYAVASLGFGILIGLFAIVGKLLGQRILADPANQKHMASLRSAFRRS